MWADPYDDELVEYIGGGLVNPQQARIREFDPEYFRGYVNAKAKHTDTALSEYLEKEFNKIYYGVKTMDSAKKSVEKILEIAKKHGYTCVVGLRKEFDAGHPIDVYSGMVGYQGDVDALMYDSIHPAWDHYKDGAKDGE